MRIKVTGLRGEGSTTVAITIARLLTELGYVVTYNGSTKSSTAHALECIRRPAYSPDRSEPVSVNIDDNV